MDKGTFQAEVTTNSKKNQAHSLSYCGIRQAVSQSVENSVK